jgi:hypothetical protein
MILPVRFKPWSLFGVNNTLRAVRLPSNGVDGVLVAWKGAPQAQTKCRASANACPAESRMAGETK